MAERTGPPWKVAGIRPTEAIRAGFRIDAARAEVL